MDAFRSLNPLVQILLFVIVVVVALSLLGWAIGLVIKVAIWVVIVGGAVALAVGVYKAFIE